MARTRSARCRRRRSRADRPTKEACPSRRPSKHSALFRRGTSRNENLRPTETHLSAGFSVAEVGELQRDAEVVLLERGDDRLEVVALLARHADLITLGL